MAGRWIRGRSLYFCQDHPYVFDRSRSIGLYDGLLKELILQFKYKACQEICRPLVELLYIGYLEYYHSERVDRIVPVLSMLNVYRKGAIIRLNY